MQSIKRNLTVIAMLTVTSVSSHAGAYGGAGIVEKPPGGKYTAVSELVALPDFLPGLGTLYVKPDTLPAGPYLAYDRDDELVSTVYMIPLDELNAQNNFESLGAPGQEAVSVDITFNPGHPGLAEAHYHVTVWHVDPASAAL